VPGVEHRVEPSRSGSFAEQTEIHLVELDFGADGPEGLLQQAGVQATARARRGEEDAERELLAGAVAHAIRVRVDPAEPGAQPGRLRAVVRQDRKSTRLNSSHEWISY